jgi:uncharacterized membrane protein YqjE
VLGELQSLMLTSSTSLVPYLRFVCAVSLVLWLIWDRRRHAN